MVLPRWLFWTWVVGTLGLMAGSAFGVLAETKYRELLKTYDAAIDNNRNISGALQVIQHRCSWAENELKKRAACEGAEK